MAAICEGRGGAVLSLVASRLTRNGCDWHTLLEFCGLVGTLIVDEEGTMSETELSVFRRRSAEAMKQKARRGELFLMAAVGSVKAGSDRIEKDADRRVQDVVHAADLQRKPALSRAIAVTTTGRRLPLAISRR